MRYGFVVPWADAADIGELAAVAEQHGWDGLFVWEPVWGVDAWVALAVAATRTSTIRLGTLITPPSRRRPWELASQVATVDRLSGGRVILSVGLGAIDSGFETFGEETDRKRRAELLDEALDIVTGLWGGQPFSYDGTHYQVQSTAFPTIGAPAQQPRPPIWCVGALGFPASMRRAMRWDGLIPQVKHSDGSFAGPTLEDVADVRRTAEPSYDIVIERQIVEGPPDEWADAGATWWIESLWDVTGSDDAVARCTETLRAGPPGQK